MLVSYCCGVLVVGMKACVKVGGERTCAVSDEFVQSEVGFGSNRLGGFIF